MKLAKLEAEIAEARDNARNKGFHACTTSQSYAGCIEIKQRDSPD